MPPGDRNGATERSALLPRAFESLGDLPDDDRPWVRYPAAFVHTTWLLLASSWVNVLLVFVPLGVASGLAKWDPVVVFVLNFLAIVPLASLLSFATEEISVKLGQTLGGLLNATFGNAVELIVGLSLSLSSILHPSYRLVMACC